MNETAIEIETDHRFEWLSTRKIREELRWVVAASLADPKSRPAAEFVAKNARKVVTRIAWYSITHLGVQSEFAVDDVAIKPLEEEIRRSVGEEDWDRRTRSIATVAISGVDDGKMMRRARDRIRAALSLLRAILPNVLEMHADEQLRFDTGDSCGFVDDPRSFHWLISASQFDLSLSEKAIEDIRAVVRLLPLGSDIQRQLTIAVGWLDRARTTDDMLIRALFLFFALESMLGDKSTGLKAHRLAFVEALLSHNEEGSFREPDRIYFLYDDLRSPAVHGSRDFDVDANDVNALDRRVHTALGNFISVVSREQIVSMRAFHAWLYSHPSATALMEWLRARSPELWTGFIWPPPRTSGNVNDSGRVSRICSIVEWFQSHVGRSKTTRRRR
jgi:hypothetical protein